MVWPRLTNSKPLYITPSKQGNCWCSSKWSNLDQFDYTYNSELDAPSLHVLLVEYMYTYGQLEH